MAKLRPALNDIEALLSSAVREQMTEDIAANDGGEVLWWGRLCTKPARPASHGKPNDERNDGRGNKQNHEHRDNQDKADSEFQVDFVEAAACGNEDSVLAHFPYMERGDVVLHNHPSGGVQPSDADLAVAGELAMQGIGFYIVNNQLTRICVVAKPVPERREQPLDLEQISDLLGTNGSLAQKAKKEGLEYEERQAQQELLRLVGSGFNQSKIVVAEGGTGIGKSFAYLLPAAFWAVRNKQRVVVSTATINLQQQLIEKDIPLIREISGLSDLQAQLVKGRSNYLCLRRLKQAEEEETSSLGLETEKSPSGLFATELADISQWADTTEDGSLSDLSFRPQSGVWNQVCGEGDNCLGLRCEFHEKCFIIHARRRAAAAHILVVNHHLLFADLELRAAGDFGYEKTAVLPPYRHTVLDEAHNIERSAQSFFSKTLSQFSAQRSLRRLYLRRKNRERGIWARLRRYAELEIGCNTDGTDGSDNQAELPDIPGCSDGLELALTELGGAAGRVMEAAAQGGPEARRSNSLRIPKQWQNLAPAVAETLDGQLWPQLKRVDMAFQTLLRAMRQVFELLENVLQGEEQKLLLEWRQLSRRLEGLRDVVSHWLGWQGSDIDTIAEKQEEETERVFWLERHRRGGRSSGDGPQYYYRLVSTQINIGSLMRQFLYRPMHSVILVSATLTVRGRFDYWFSRVGLDKPEAQETQEAPKIEAAEETLKTLEPSTSEEPGQPQNPKPNHQDRKKSRETDEEERGETDDERLTASVYASPFDYHNRVHLLLATDAPNPAMGRDFETYVSRFAREALETMGGRSLLLFTSYAAMNKCYEFLQDTGNFDILRQGEDDSARLLQRFKDEEGLSLLATDSFWEGVDAPGRTLMQLLLCRLPFRAPDDPIVAAHTEYLEQRGENAFFQYSLPEAILRFRQGFGRLMRLRSDQGLVAVMDPRIVSKRYGRDFLHSLPSTQVLRGDFSTLQNYIRQYAENQL
ncbi:helicase C-terminal domain-containing protein [Candidatus Haliotispira prima]|uniref:Helicase C-terminal domain-containing protein n=1 Tax=Candidatus Haliotispira prima TaxID=3034016 RepID=A0ABY8MF79_9SPIO|nr:helicase C-terminal domain-containing protein [Candidatus Haliotispira prima]